MVLNGAMARDFSDAQQVRFRQLLETELDADMANASAATRNMRLISDARDGSSTDDEHDPEGVTLAFERSHEASMVERSERGVAEATAALKRLDDGGYGICAECGGDIAVKRLDARPATTLCIDCARRQSP